MNIISQIIKFFKDVWNFVFNRKADILAAGLELKTTVEQVDSVIKKYELIYADKQITLPEAMELIEELKKLLAQIEEARKAFDNIK